MARPPLSSIAMGCAPLEAFRVSISSCSCCSCLLYFASTCSFSCTGMAIFDAGYLPQTVTLLYSLLADCS